MATLPPMRAERTTESYRGFTLVHERMGHTNVVADDQWWGGYPTAAAAKERVDGIIRSREIRRNPCPYLDREGATFVLKAWDAESGRYYIAGTYGTREEATAAARELFDR